MKKTLTVRLDSRFYNQLESISAKKGVSKSFLVREALEGTLSAPHEEVDAALLKSMTTALKKTSQYPSRQIGNKLKGNYPNHRLSGLLPIRL